MCIGKKIFLIPMVILAIFFAININAEQECNTRFEQHEFRNLNSETACSKSKISNPNSEINNPQSKISTIQSTPQHAQINKEEFVKKTQKLQMPFIANNGQLDETVKFYAKTFAGSVFVTKDGEIVYSLPKIEESPSPNPHSTELTTKPHRGSGIMVDSQQGTECISPVVWVDQSETQQDNYHAENPKSEIKNSKSVALTEEFVGGKINEIKGESQSVTKVNYFTGNDPSQWKTNVSTYDVVDLGEIYSNINVKLKAYGNNVEKLFYVRPGAEPDTIRMKLNGAKALKVNENGELVAETELGSVKFTKRQHI
jgi:hypothetical protein